MGRPVIVTEYDPEWPAAFDRVRERALALVGEMALGIEHVGSTSVPGLAAKPILDVDVIVRNHNVSEVIERLESGGYRHLGNLGIEGREAFSAPAELPPHHLYVCVDGGRAVKNHLAFRDHLRTHPDAARGYAALKRRLAREFPYDIDAYVAGKTEFVLGILGLYGLPPDDLRVIDLENSR